MSFLIAALFALTPTHYAEADAAIFSGSDVKILKSNLDFNGNAKAIVQSGDPTSVAVSAPKGSILLNTNTGFGYIKSDAGSSTNWNRLIFGSSAGVLAVASGGTNKSSYTKGDILIASSSTVLTALPVSADRTYLMASSDSTTGVVWKAFIAPTVQSLTVGSGTYTTPSGVRYLIVKMVGGGGGGAGSGTTPGTPGAATSSTFGSSLLTAALGSPGSGTVGGAGGACTINAPAVQMLSATGSAGSGVANLANSPGGIGGSNYFGGYGGAAAGGAANAGGAAPANTGGGGGGGSVGGASLLPGGGGGAACYLEAVISSPSATYSYVTGAKGTGGTLGTNGAAGGNGSDGIIWVWEYYQ